MADLRDACPLPTAYCAPGRRDVAAIVLAVRSEEVGEVIEHPWLTGWDGIMLVAPPGDWPALEVGDLAPLAACGWRMPL